MVEEWARKHEQDEVAQKVNAPGEINPALPSDGVELSEAVSFLAPDLPQAVLPPSNSTPLNVACASESCQQQQKRRASSTSQRLDFRWPF